MPSLHPIIYLPPLDFPAFDEHSYCETEVPFALWDTHSPTYLDWHPEAIVRWLKREPYVLSGSRYLAGVPKGIRWGLYVLLCATRAVHLSCPHSASASMLQGGMMIILHYAGDLLAQSIEQAIHAQQQRQRGLQPGDAWSSSRGSSPISEYSSTRHGDEPVYAELYM